MESFGFIDTLQRLPGLVVRQAFAVRDTAETLQG